jgi:hypothetical protein
LRIAGSGSVGHQPAGAVDVRQVGARPGPDIQDLPVELAEQ